MILLSFLKQNWSSILPLAYLAPPGLSSLSYVFLPVSLHTHGSLFTLFLPSVTSSTFMTISQLYSATHMHTTLHRQDRTPPQRLTIERRDPGETREGEGKWTLGKTVWGRRL